MRLSLRTLLPASLTVLLAMVATHAQEQRSAELIPVGDLSSDAYAALEEATLDSVTATISFLASDELAGRGSFTKEFDIAAAYVASRLRAAGAEGLGASEYSDHSSTTNGSFFIESPVEMSRAPRDGVRLNTGESDVRISALSGAPEGLRHSGSIRVVDSLSAASDAAGPVIIRLPEEALIAIIRSSRQLAQLATVAARAKVSAILFAAEPSSAAWAVAESKQAKGSFLSGRQTNTIPMAVVDAKAIQSDATWELVIPAAIVEQSMMRNVAGVIRGSDPTLADECVLFSAHLDHLGEKPPGGSGESDSLDEDLIYNGADDDASGVTAVLTLADIYGAMKTPPKRSVLFVTFWGEEMGLLGSKRFVDECPWPTDRIVANVNIEMIGRPEEGAKLKMWMTGWKQSDLGQLFQIGARRVGIEVFEHPKFSEMLYRRSDNAAFVDKGVVAHSFSAGSLHADYHQVSDEWTMLDLPHMTQVIRGLYAGSLPIADGVYTPK